MSKAFRKFFKKELRRAVVDSARSVAVEIMNGLVEAGPAYSGAFSSAWYAVEPGQEPGGPRKTGTEYRYTLRNIPKGKFRSGTYYEIVNGASYAPQALDLEEGVFRSQLDEDGDIVDPIKTGFKVIGSREGPKRGQVSEGDGFAVSTAPQDWYVNYTRGGAMKRNLEKGVKIGFRQGPLGGRSSTYGFGR